MADILRWQVMKETYLFRGKCSYLERRTRRIKDCSHDMKCWCNIGLLKKKTNKAVLRHKIKVVDTRSFSSNKIVFMSGLRLLFTLEQSTYIFGQH